MRAVTCLATLWLGAAAAACATGEPAGGGGDDDVDAPVGPPIDGAASDTPDVDAPPIDAPSVDAPGVDAPGTDAPSIDAPSIDAPGCTPTTTQLLVNPALDATPLGTGWVESPTNAAYPIISSAAGAVAAHTAPARAWLAGLHDAVDVMYQDVAIPAGTTGLVLRGMYEVRSDELGLGGPYDFAWLELTSTTGTVLETVLAVTERNRTTAWTAFSKTFTGAYAGQTVRIRFRATTDASDISAFFFDSLALDATSCP